MIMKGKYFFLSNFYPCNVTYNGFTYQNTEAAFQAQKCPGREAEFCNLNPSEAKKLGRHVKLRSDWEDIKIDEMRKILQAKFSDKDLMDKLLAVKEPIVEDNTWNDTFWGVCRGKGENHLGKLLEEIRDFN